MPPEHHFDKGLGKSAWEFREASKQLLEGDVVSSDLLLPICYLQRHSIELYLKSLIFILHKKFEIDFGEGFSLEKPAIKDGNKWKQLSNIHNLEKLFNYFQFIFQDHFHLLPEKIDWSLSPDIQKEIQLINGYDASSTFFRYPQASSSSQDRKKSKVQPIEVDDAMERLGDKNTPSLKFALLMDSQDNIISSFDINTDPLVELKAALQSVMEYLHNLHCAFLGELTGWS